MYIAEIVGNQKVERGTLMQWIVKHVGYCKVLTCTNVRGKIILGTTYLKLDVHWTMKSVRH